MSQSVVLWAIRVVFLFLVWVAIIKSFEYMMRVTTGVLFAGAVPLPEMTPSGYALGLLGIVLADAAIVLYHRRKRGKTTGV